MKTIFYLLLYYSTFSFSQVYEFVKTKENKISNCYDEYNSENVHQISRNGMILSAIKKNNNE